MQASIGQNIAMGQDFNAVCGTVESVSEDGQTATLSNVHTLFGPLSGAARVPLWAATPWDEAPRTLGLADVVRLCALNPGPAFASLEIEPTPEVKAPVAPPLLSVSELKERLKKNSIVLWPYRGHVEEGTVINVRGDQVDLIWLEGYQSRNDTIAVTEVLSLWDLKGPDMSIFPFSGKGHLTEAGQTWIAAHPRPQP